MFRRRKKFRQKDTPLESLIGRQTEIHGDARFSGRLLVDGTVKGNVLAEDEESSILNLSQHGTIEGDVRVPNAELDGVVIGDVHAREQVKLAANARITGNVYYHLLEMEMGAEVNGSLVHIGEEVEIPVKLEHGPRLQMAEET